MNDTRNSLSACGRLLLGATLVALLLPGVASAAQRYAGPGGSGTACTQAAPCGFRDAVNGAMAGDEVIVLPGDHGSAAVPLPPLVFTAAAADIHGQVGAARPRVFLSGLGLQLSSASVSDLDLRNVDPGGGWALDLINGASAARVVASSSKDSGCRLSGTVTISDSVCRAETIGWGAFMTQGTPATATLRNVTAIAAGAAAGIFVGASAPVTLNATNVIARGSGGKADVETSVAAGQTVTIALDHSNFATRTMGGPGTSSVTDPATNGNQTAVPLFADAAAGDYHQRLGSPTIDAGAARPPGALDLDREQRTLGAAPDVGADEFDDRTPVVTTGAAGAVGSTTATLNAAVDPRGLPTDARFEYGTTVAYGLQTPSLTLGALTGGQPVTATLSGLNPSTTYHYRAVASNPFAARSGADATFTTAPRAAGPGSGPGAGRCARLRRGTARGETVRGTAGGDRLLGLGGADRLLGIGGEDCLDGGPGNDRLDGGAGEDRLAGGAGNDVLRGGAGRDRLGGGPGNDDLSGGAGTDELSGGAGNDRISATDGRTETVSCGPGRDSVTVDRKDRVRGCEHVRRR